MIDISSFKATRVLVVGDVMIDRYYWGSVSRISPEAPVPIVKLDRESSRPGGAANVAANAAALGSRVDIVGIVGADADAAELRSNLAGLGIDDQYVMASTTRGTIVKTRIIAHGQQIVRLDREETGSLSPDDTEKLIASVYRLLPNSDLVILSDYGKGALSEKVTHDVLAKCRSLNKPVLADPKGKNFSKYSGATIVTPNRREAAEACKIEESDPDLVLKAGETLLTEFDFENILITESEDGMTLFQSNSEPVHFGTTAREVYDVTGAGDTVIGCLGVAIAAGFPLVEAARVANIAAGLSVQHIGTVPVSFEELHRELRENHADLLAAGTIG